MEIPATRARGMAIPRAQGQEITITVTALIRASPVERPRYKHTSAVPPAIARMAAAAIKEAASKSTFGDDDDEEEEYDDAAEQGERGEDGRDPGYS